MVSVLPCSTALDGNAALPVGGSACSRNWRGLVASHRSPRPISSVGASDVVELLVGTRRSAGVRDCGVTLDLRQGTSAAEQGCSTTSQLFCGGGIYIWRLAASFSLGDFPFLRSSGVAILVVLVRL
jgi:hypothetical protein